MQCTAWQSKNIPTARQLCIHQSGQPGHCEQLDVAGRSISLVDNDTCTVLNQADLKYLCSTSQHSLQCHHTLAWPGSKDDNLDHPANGSDYNPQTQQASHHTHQIICLTRSYFGLTWSVCLSNCHNYHQHHHDCQHPVDYRSMESNTKSCIWLKQGRQYQSMNWEMVSWKKEKKESLWAASRNDCMQFKSWKNWVCKKINDCMHCIGGKPHF